MPAMWENFVCEVANAPGTGAVTLLGAEPSIPSMTFLTAGYTTGSWVYYVITDGAAGGASEEVMGQYNSSTNTLSRATTIRTNSGGTSPLNFTGPVKVFAFAPASKVAYYDNTDNLRPPLNIILPNASAYFIKDASGTARGLLEMTPANYVHTRVAGGVGTKWRVLNQAGDTELLGIDNAGNLNVAGIATFSGVVTSDTGYAGKAGTAGGLDTHKFNMYYDGSFPHVYVDTFDFGVISFVSDRRIKRMITDNASGALARIMALRPVSYHFANVGLIQDDGKERLGFIADEVEQIIPSAVNGMADALQEDLVTPQPQSLNVMPIIAEMTSAIKELKTIIDAQAVRIAALENA